jgi:diacylglycerol kinase family enzyme
MCAERPGAGTLHAVRVLLVVNPRATRVTPARQALVERVLGAEHELTVCETEARDHATELARGALAQRCSHVVVLAGDGTLNEVVAALADTEVAVATLPGGSTNVFSRSLGQPDDLEAATALVSAAIRDGRTRRVGLGSVNGRHFLIHTGVGWDAEVVSIVERHAELKPRLGHGLFVYAGLRAFFRTYDRRRPHFSVHLSRDGRRDAVVMPEAYFALVLNSDPYTYVHTRPFTVDPAKTLDVPLTMVVLRSMRVARFLPVMARALRGNGLRSTRCVTVVRDVEEVTLRRLHGTPRPSMPHQVDGDHLGQADELLIRHHRDALAIVDTTR